jgi:hypothetical protein
MSTECRSNLYTYKTCIYAKETNVVVNTSCCAFHSRIESIDSELVEAIVVKLYCIQCVMCDECVGEPCFWRRVELLEDS